MNARIYSRIALAAAVFAATSVAHAAVNPLDPNYYQHKSAATEVVSAEAVRYMDSANPLAPTFYESKAAVVQFEGAAVQVSAAYRDINNPLNPAYNMTHAM